jgi:hypothetical protein
VFDPGPHAFNVCARARRSVFLQPGSLAVSPSVLKP